MKYKRNLYDKNKNNMLKIKKCRYKKKSEKINYLYY